MFENSSEAAGNSRRPILLVCLAVFGLMTGQQMVNPILAPLARELGFSELALGLVMTVGASGVVLTSPFWGRRAIAWGHRPVLLTSLVGAMAALLAFAVVAQVGLSGVLAVPLLFVLVLLTRGLAFGLAWAATPVTAQSYVADVTTGEAERIRGMSLFGAAQGLALAVGPALGGLLSFGGLLVPMYVAPVILGAIAVVLWLSLPKPQAHRERPVTVKVSAFDRRMWPFLTACFGMYLGLTLVLMTVGFLLQDRLHLAADETGQATGLVMLAGAGMIVLVQALVIPRLGWRPARLIQTGALIMTVGMVAVTVAQTGVLVAVGVGVLGLGLGFGMPGIMSAPTLLAGKEEQSSVAGLLNSCTALTFMVGPLIGNGLYEIAPAVPYVLGAVMMAALTVFVFVHPGVRQVPAARVEARALAG
ncbi:MFS transporter [Labedaea rhizosphaerae]|uniref:Putative MFS family arabinose efflux permease n=1 Tax=Labedaea rhizosphaerae TaxID=598644 RepID=A0A4R6S8V0_LABRH|nr:MFS transporter [Labedaea rhizosphaerae]TDP96201.1 putative MFS family arabinose efflux permease [Labedaea rhizosphaerae]